jgi:hypothetical protein
MSYTAPEIGLLSAHDYNKIRTSFDAFKISQQPANQQPGYDPFSRTFRSQWDRAAAEAKSARKPYKSGGSYGIEDEYRYLVGETDFRPTVMYSEASTADDGGNDGPTQGTSSRPTGFNPTYLPTDGSRAYEGIAGGVDIFTESIGPDGTNYGVGFGPGDLRRAREEGYTDTAIKEFLEQKYGGFAIADPIKAELGIGQAAAGGGGTTTTDPAGSDGDSIASMLAAQIAQMQSSFMQSMQQQTQHFQQMQAAQQERMAALQQQMMQAQVANRPREQVSGVKTAVGESGTPMQIARRGVTGAFNRRGMRISNINV